MHGSRHNKVDRLIYLFSKLPGLGARTAKRIALHLIKHKDRLMNPIGEALLDAARCLRTCDTCANVDVCNPCSICTDPKRAQNLICVVESLSDLWAIESGKFYQGVYHVLGGVISAQRQEVVNVNSLVERVNCADGGTEVIVATNSTLDGQATAFFVLNKLKGCPRTVVTRFASGVPMGGELDYLDEVTLSAAFSGRRSFVHE